MSFSEWREVKLGDFLNFRRGHDLPKKKMKSGKIPVVGSNGIIGYHDEHTTENPCITIGRSGNVGTPHITHSKAWAHNTTLYIDNFKGNDPTFIYYLLKTLNLKHYKGGSAVPTLNRNHIHPIDISVPTDVNEQKEIAHILSTLDKKIEVNNKINKTLEEIAKAIFKHWFVDFEFPNEDGEPYKSSGGEMIDSELGPIPKGWEVGTLGDYMRVKSGFAFKSKWWKESGVPVIKIKNLSNGIVDYSDVGYVEVDKIEAAKDFIVKSGDILIAMTGATIGKIGLVYEFNNTILVNQRVGKFFIGKNPFEKLPFAFTILTNSRINDEIISLGGGSAQPNISPSQIESIKIAMPISNQVEIFNSLLNPVMRIYIDNIKENAKLQQLRDTLLPKLMSGEIRVPLDIEEQ